MIINLPTTVEINGKDVPIRADYRDILAIIESQETCEENERALAAIMIFYPEYDAIEDYSEAVEKMSWFISCGVEDNKSGGGTQLISWTQDWNYIVSAVNRVAGYEVRSVPFLHWWTFISYFQEIGDCALAQIVSIRSKRAKHKKLDAWEQEYYREHKNAIDIHRTLLDSELAALDILKGVR